MVVSFDSTQIKSATDNVGTFSSQNPDIRYHRAVGEEIAREQESEESYIEATNKRFNEELDDFKNNKHNGLLHLGKPGRILTACGINAASITISPTVLRKHLKKHNLTTDDLKGLAKEIQEPILSYKHGRRSPNVVVVTELDVKGGKLSASFILDSNGNVVEVSNISSVHSKDAKIELERIQEMGEVDLSKSIRWVNKEKALDWLSPYSYENTGTTVGQEPFDVAKVLKDFKNPSISGENMEDTAAYRQKSGEESTKANAQTTALVKRNTAQQLSERLNTPISIVESTDEISHPTPSVQARRRRAKGWYDRRTGEAVIVLPNCENAEDVAATVAHETIAHKGLRELVGEKRYDEFLDEVYSHLRGDLKQQVEAEATRAFIDDITKNGKRARTYEQHRRTATDELLGRMAEKPFEEFTEGERTLWGKLKRAVLKVLDNFLGTLKLPKWFELGDNELRYILWRSKERLERGREHPIDLARDIVKREELGLDEKDVAYLGTKKDAHPTRLQTSYDAQAVQRDAHLSGTKVEINSKNRAEIEGNISSLAKKVAESRLPAEDFLAELRKSMMTESEDHSGYNTQIVDGELLTMRISDHHANAKHNKQNGEFKVVSVVIKTPYSNNRFRQHKNVEMVEYTFDANTLSHENEKDILAGISQWLQTGKCDIKGAVTFVVHQGSKRKPHSTRMAISHRATEL